MQTQCPQCETRFRVTDTQLNAAEGNVRCGLCDEVFIARDTEQDINLPEITADFVQKPDDDKAELDQTNQDTPQQEEIEANDAFTQDETQSSNDDASGVVTSNEALLTENETGDRTDTEFNDEDNNDLEDEGNNTDEINDETSDSKPEHESSERESSRHESSKHASDDSNQSDDKNIDDDSIDLNDLDIDNAKQNDDADDEEIYLDEQDSNIYNDDSLNDDIDIEINDNEEQTLDLFDEKNHQDSPQIIPDELRGEVAANDTPIGNKIAWVGGTLLLSMTLLLQYFWLNRDQFIQSAEAQALVEKVCLDFDCSKLTIRDPSNIELLTRNVYSHPNEKNALMISIALQNNAKFSQPYPVLQINFSDIRGDAVVARRFSPAEYLTASHNKQALLQPGDDAKFNLEIRDPGKQAITYEFNFL